MQATARKGLNSRLLQNETSKKNADAYKSGSKMGNPDRKCANHRALPLLPQRNPDRKWVDICSSAHHVTGIIILVSENSTRSDGERMGDVSCAINTDANTRALTQTNTRCIEIPTNCENLTESRDLKNTTKQHGLETDLPQDVCHMSSMRPLKCC